MSSSSVSWSALIPLHISAGPHEGMWGGIATLAPIPDETLAAGWPLSTEGCIGASTCPASPLPMSRAPRGTMQPTLVAQWHPLCRGPRHQRTSFLTGYIACGHWYVLTLSPTAIQVLSPLLPGDSVSLLCRCPLFFILLYCTSPLLLHEK